MSSNPCQVSSTGLCHAILTGSFWGVFSRLWHKWVEAENGWKEWSKASAVHFRAMHTLDNTDEFVNLCNRPTV